MVSDPNLSDFYSRVSRIETARSQGLGFEAPGTLGRSHYFRPSRRRRGILAPLVLLLVSVFGLKAMIHYSVGGEVYRDRVAALSAGSGFEPLGAAIMQADPVTEALAFRIGQFANWIK